VCNVSFNYPKHYNFKKIPKSADLRWKNYSVQTDFAFIPARTTHLASEHRPSRYPKYWRSVGPECSKYAITTKKLPVRLSVTELVVALSLHFAIENTLSDRDYGRAKFTHLNGKNHYYEPQSMPVSRTGTG